MYGLDISFGNQHDAITGYIIPLWGVLDYLPFNVGFFPDISIETHSAECCAQLDYETLIRTIIDRLACFASMTECG
jgi:hypothetical protein